MTNEEIMEMYLKDGENYATVARAAGLPISDVIRLCTTKGVMKRPPSIFEAEKLEARRKRREMYFSQSHENDGDDE